MISFVIPTLNEETTIEETLRNLSKCTRPHEIIVSDGGSSDRTIEIAKKYNCTVIRHLSSHRQTIAEGRNIGAFAAKGDYIVELDADSRIPNIDYFFDVMTNKFDEDPEIVGATTWFRVYPEDETFLDWLIYGITGYVSLISDNYFGLSAASGGEFQMMRADAFRAIGGYDKTIVAMEDNEMFARLRTQGTIYFEDALFIYHSGRRAHKIGWGRMILEFFANCFSIAVFGKSASRVWTQVR